MLILLDKNKVKIAALTQLKDYYIKEKINTEEVLAFSLSFADENNNLIEEECYIETEEQRYIVKAIKNQSTLSRYECKLDLEELKSKLHLEGFNSVTLTVGETIRLAIAGTGWSVEDKEAPARKRSLKLDATNALDIINKAIKKFSCEIRFNTKEKIIIVKEKFGNNKGVYFSDQLNLKALNTTSDTLDFATRMYVRGKDGLTFSDINNGKDYVEDFSYSNKIINVLWSDARYTDKESMLEDAELKIKDICKPKKSYDVDILDLASIHPEYSFLSYGLGDEITLLSSKDKFSDKQRIVELTRYPLEPEKNNAIIANTQLSFEDLQKQAEETQEVVDGFINEDGTINGSKVDGLPDAEFVIEDGSITANKIAANAITTDKLNAGAVTAEKIDAGAINAGHISAGTITANSAIIDDLAIGTAKIANGAITNAKIEDAAIDSAKIDKLAVNSAHIQNAAIGTAKIEDAAITNAKIGKLAVGEANIANASITDAKIKNLSAEKITTGDLSTDRLKANVIDAINAYIGDATIDSAKIGNLDAHKITTGDLSADRIKAGVISAINLSTDTATINSAKIGDLEADKITTGDISTDRMKANAINAVNATIGDAVISSAKIANLDASKITTGTLNADRIKAGSIDVTKINSETISAIEVSAGELVANKIASGEIKVGNANIVDGTISGAKIVKASISEAQIAKATITDASIKSLNANKITAGKIDATKVNISSTSGKLSIADNTITIKDNQATPKTRVQIGLDARGNYGIYVLNASGQAIFDSEKGVLAPEGLNSNVVTTDKIKDEAIGSSKLNVDELFVGDNAFIKSLKAVEIDAANITTGKISSERLDINGLVSFDALDKTLQPIFDVQGDKTYINGGMIAANTIKADKIDLLSGLTVNGADGKPVFAIGKVDGKDGVGTVEINGWLHSSNYVKGKSGYSINTDGTAEINQATIRGTLDVLDAGVTNTGTAATDVRIWAGGSYENRASAKFRVNKNGDLYATNATLAGILYGEIESNNLHVKDSILTIKDKVKLSETSCSFNTDVTINNKVKYSTGNNSLELKDTNFMVNSAQASVSIDKSSGAYGGLNVIGCSQGHHVFRGSTASDKLGTLVIDAEGNQGQRGDFSFTRKNYAEKCKVDIDGDLTICEKINSTVQQIEMRSVKNSSWDGWGFYAN